MCFNEKRTCDFFSGWWDMFACFMPGGAVWCCGQGDRIKDLERLKEHLKARLSELDEQLEKLKKEQAEA